MVFELKGQTKLARETMTKLKAISKAKGALGISDQMKNEVMQ